MEELLFLHQHALRPGSLVALHWDARSHRLALRIRSPDPADPADPAVAPPPAPADRDPAPRAAQVRGQILLLAAAPH